MARPQRDRCRLLIHVFQGLYLIYILTITPYLDVLIGQRHSVREQNEESCRKTEDLVS